MKRCLMSQAPTQGLTQPDCQAPTPNMPKWLKAYGYWMFFWAFMVAVSRIFVGKHYLGDVIVGILVGSLAGWIFARLSALICRRIH